MSDIPPLYCANHPNIETGLRCNQCEKPICPKCAVLTPTGYRCKDCLRTQQRIFETASWYDPLIAVIIAAVLSFLGSLLVGIMGFFTLFIAPIAGVVIAEVIRIAVRRRRSVRLYQAATAATILGGLPLLVIALINALGNGLDYGFSYYWDLIWQAVYIFTSASTVLYRLKGIRIG
jgi:hypothetical protein